MVTDYKKIDLFGKTLIQKVDVTAPFEFAFPESNQACFLYMLQGELDYQSNTDQLHIPNKHSLLLNCIHSGKQIQSNKSANKGEIIIITFHPDVLKKIYEKGLPLLLQSNTTISNQSKTIINNDFLIHKYIESLLFYFENPSLVNDEILVLKLKEIVLLLSQTQDVTTIQVILSQLFSPTSYTFKKIIEANLFTQSSVEELAQKTNLSTSSFKREFKKLYNDSPASYIKNKKLEKAAALLLISEERITDIAFDCGFNDPANFTKSFHDKYHMSPSNYRINQTKKQ
ncbi:helix-turn-helix domain-containing protein [Zhouia sp. PK063]|uniref:helix-turn-helix domain-containing protein n=1 Tax=Zhouia sp. PK063 TaxID=3373602 RepID=UPI0037AE45FC